MTRALSRGEPLLTLLAAFSLCGTETRGQPPVAPPPDQERAADADLNKTFDFETEPTGWLSFDPEAKLTLDDKEWQAGASSLRYDYTPRKDAFCALALADLRIAGAKSLSFWLKTSRPTAIILSLAEADESRYQALVYSNKNAWTKVALDVESLDLSDDTQDENARLDADQVRTFALADLALLEAQAGKVDGEPRSLWIDDLIFSTTAVRQPPVGPDQVLDDFEQSLVNWIPVEIETGGGKERINFSLEDSVALIREEDKAAQGRGTLRYTYRVGHGRVDALTGAAKRITMARPRALRFRLKADHSAFFGVMLSERDKSEYSVGFYHNKGTWQPVALSFDDFKLSSDSTDENGRLDLDQVSTIVLLDAAGLLGQLQTLPTEERTLWLDDVAVSQQEVPPTFRVEKTPRGSRFVVDSCEQPTIGWMPCRAGGDPPKFEVEEDAEIVLVTKEAAPPEGKQALRLRYSTTPQTITAFVRFLDGLALKRPKHLSFWIKSEKDRTLALTVEEKDGSEYNVAVQARAAEGWKQHAFELSEFKLSEGKQDENGKLDMDQVKQLTLADISGLQGQPGQNTIWLDDLVVAEAE